MSIGNLKTDGGKGTNWPWQYKMLKGLQGIIDVINSTANGSEYEAKLVNITCTGVPFNETRLYLEVRVWDTVTGAFTGSPTYYLPGSTVGVPLATFTDAGCTIEYLEAGDATEATLDKVKKALTSQTAGSKMLRLAAVTTPGTNNIILDSVKSISFYNAHATVNAQIEAGTSGNVVLKPGETINFDAGGNGNKFPAGEFEYDPDPTTPGAGDLLIIYVT